MFEGFKKFDPSKYNPATDRYSEKKTHVSKPANTGRRRILLGVVGLTIMGLGAEGIRKGVEYLRHEYPLSDGIQDSKISFTNQKPSSPQSSLIGKVGLLKNAQSPVVTNSETISIKNDPRIARILGLTPEEGESIEFFTGSYRVSFQNEASIPTPVYINELSGILLLNQEEINNNSGRTVLGWTDDSHHANVISEFLSQEDRTKINVVGFWMYGSIKNDVTQLVQSGLRFIVTRIPQQ